MPDLMDEKPTPELVKSMVTVPEVLDLLGIEVDNNGKFTLRDERTPSVHAYEDHYHDYGTGEGGDVIDLVMHVADVPFNKAMWLLWTKSLRAGREPGDVERQPVREVQDFTEELEQYGGAVPADWPGLSLPPNARADRRDGLLFIPHQDEEGVYGVKVRGSDGSKSAWPGSQFTKKLYCPAGWGYDQQGQYYPRQAVITEGETDCWAVRETLPDNTAITLALPSGAGSWKDAWLKDLEPFETIYLCMDNDRAGKQALDKLHRKIGWGRTKALLVPPLFNDAREAIAAGWRPSI